MDQTPQPRLTQVQARGKLCCSSLTNSVLPFQDVFVSEIIQHARLWSCSCSSALAIEVETEYLPEFNGGTGDIDTLRCSHCIQVPYQCYVILLAKYAR